MEKTVYVGLDVHADTIAVAQADEELLSNLVFEGFGSCSDLVWVGGFNSIFERDASDDFGEVVKAA